MIGEHCRMYDRSALQRTSRSSWTSCPQLRLCVIQLLSQLHTEESKQTLQTLIRRLAYRKLFDTSARRLVKSQLRQEGGGNGTVGN